MSTKKAYVATAGQTAGPRPMPLLSCDFGGVVTLRRSGHDQNPDGASDMDGSAPSSHHRTGDTRRWPYRPTPLEPSRATLLARVASLEEKLLTLPDIEQAKGALMLTYGISADAAFNLLRFHSMNRNVKVRAIAAQLTTLMCASPTSATAIARFDELLDTVSDSLTHPSADSHRTAIAPSGNPAAATVPWSDIPPDKIAEVMLAAVATAPPGITIATYTTDMPLVYVNDAFSTMTGYEMGDVAGRNCRFLQGPAPTLATSTNSRALFTAGWTRASSCGTIASTVLHSGTRCLFPPFEIEPTRSPTTSEPRSTSPNTSNSVSQLTSPLHEGAGPPPVQICPAKVNHQARRSAVCGRLHAIRAATIRLRYGSLDTTAG